MYKFSKEEDIKRFLIDLLTYEEEMKTEIEC